MYTDNNCKILKKDFIAPYIKGFQEYYITTIYGNDLVMGSDLIDDAEVSD